MSNSETPLSINEHLSALLDDEAGSFEQRRVLDELKNDDTLSEKLSNFALIGETMRSGKPEQSVPLVNSSFLEGIHSRLDAEELYSQVQIDQDLTSDSQESALVKEKASWLRPFGGFAVAASFGALALMGIQNASLLDTKQVPETETTFEASSATQIAELASIPTKNIELSQNENTVDAVKTTIHVAQNDQYNNANAQIRSSLKRYVDSHMQYATTSAFVPTVRVIAYTNNQ